MPNESYIFAQLMHILSKNIKAQRSSLSGGRMKKAMIIMGYAKIRNAMVQEVLKYKSQKKKTNILRMLTVGWQIRRKKNHKRSITKLHK